MPAVPMMGVLSYNGYSNFSAFTKHGVITCRPVPDTSGRTVVYNEYTIPLRTTVTGTLCPVEVPKMRAALTKNGGQLIITNLLAFGDLAINIGTVRDVSWGPWIEGLQFTHPGGRQAVHIDWTLRFRIPECGDAKYRGVPMDYSWTPTYSVDDCGYTVRNTSIRLRIPQNRLVPGSPLAQDSLENYVELAVPPEIPGYRRTFGPREFSADRTEIRWSVTDTEFEKECPPPGIVKETGSVTFTSDGTAGAVWNGVFSYSCELPKNGVLEDAVQAGEDFIQDRRKKLTKLKNKDGSDACVIPLVWTITEPDVFGRRKYDVSVTFSVTTTRDQLLNRGGIWSPVESRGQWRLWSQSLQDSALNPRGYAKLVFDAGGDGIVDLCATGNVFDRQIGVDSGSKDKPGVLKGKPFEPTTPKNGWLKYNNSINTRQDSGVVGTRTLPKKPLDSSTDRGGTNDAITNPMDSGGAGGVGGGIKFNPPPGGGGVIINEPTDKGKNTARRVRRPQQDIVMTGEAIRVGYPIPEPTLVSVNGVNVIPANRLDMEDGFQQEVVFNTGLQPVYRATWQLRYLPDGDLPDLPLPVAPNPMLS